ncbi:hypothetical protein [Ralstonia insidiosa]|uniref:Uncharacterized protein n=1 Tax=Ralstonia insidiosa TaxID=190721 RepID=A0A848NXH3_9RALS|nr:hypothetical protein [Ralstonia insidiosa]NMV37957.1 hypothetical protein [Ralstonia insidiosa]
MNVLANTWKIVFNEETKCLEFWHPERLEWPSVQLRMETLSAMSFDDAAKFVGERLLLLIPTYHEVFKDYLWSDDGQTPPKKQ